jgi:2-C-methyl-D-erythritol 4-phosphate cytidylyltransferase
VVIDRVILALGEGWDGVVPALEVADTLKRARADGAVIETVEREGLYGAQTPQAFVAETFRRALAGSTGSPTDCAGFVEASGGRVRIVEGDRRLVKVTTAEDLELVEALLSR